MSSILFNRSNFEKWFFFLWFFLQMQAGICRLRGCVNSYEEVVKFYPSALAEHRLSKYPAVLDQHTESASNSIQQILANPAAIHNPADSIQQNLQKPP